MSLFFVNHAAYLIHLRKIRIKKHNIQRRLLRDMHNPFELDDRQFIKLFRINKYMSKDLCDELRDFLNRTHPRGLPVHVQVLSAMRFFAEGSYQKSVAQDLFFGLSQPSVSRCVTKVSLAILEKYFNEKIKFPKTHIDRERISKRFQDTAHFPGILGCIDCTHVAIVSPGQKDAHKYKNHKGFFSLNVQMICDFDLKILNVNARFPGTVHDTFIFNQSKIKEVMVRLWSNRLGKYFLLGDTGYTDEVFMLTPIPDAAPGTKEFNYTIRHCKTRNCVERLFGALKAKFRCLRGDRTLHYAPKKAALIINACATLHNIMKEYGIPDPEEDTSETEQDVFIYNDLNVNEHNRISALAVRQQIIDNYF